MGNVPASSTIENGARRGDRSVASRADATVETHRTHAIRRLVQGEDGRFCATGGRAFSPQGYSLFKHGDERWARRFGREVADFLMVEEADLFDRMRPNEVLIAPFPYKYVPTAAALMVGHAVSHLNHVLSGEGKPSVGYLHAFKFPWQASGEHYFAHMGEEARRRILDKVGLSVDENRLRGAHLIVVDDIRVTGATEDRFLELLYRVEGLRSLTVVYLCRVDLAVAGADPAIEGRINQHGVKNLDDVAAIAAIGEFRWNIRVVKFVLEEQDARDFDAFVGGLKDGTLLALYEAVVFNDYHLERDYERRVRILRSAVEVRGLV